MKRLSSLIGIFLASFILTTSAQIIISPIEGGGGGGTTIVGGSCTDQVMTAISTDGTPTCSDIALAMADSATGTGAFVFATSPIFSTNIDIGSAGVRLSDDGDGALTLLGLGNGFDENIILNLDDTENTLVITSSTGLNTINASSMALTVSSCSGCESPGSFGITIDGGGSEITTGIKGFIEIPFSGTITQATLLSTDSAATTGSIVIDIWCDSYANYPPTDSDSITSATPPTLSSANKSQDSTLSSWTTSVTAGNVCGFNVDSVTTVTRTTLILTVDK